MSVEHICSLARSVWANEAPCHARFRGAEVVVVDGDHHDLWIHFHIDGTPSEAEPDRKCPALHVRLRPSEGVGRALRAEMADLAYRCLFWRSLALPRMSPPKWVLAYSFTINGRMTQPTRLRPCPEWATYRR